VDARGRPLPLVQARYEATRPHPTRSWLPGYVTSAKSDMGRATRRELLRKARYLYKNSPFIRGMVERLVAYVIGTGLHPVPATSDENFNRAALREWQEWEKRTDLTSRHNFRQLQAVVFRAMLLDGDIFTLLTYGPSGRPRVQLIEGHQVGGGWQDADDGVKVDAFDRPAFYNFLLGDDLGGNQKAESIPADDAVHHYFPERAGQRRGLTMLAAAINTAHDIDDILELEKAAVKDASAKTDIIKTASGELDSDGIGASLRPPINGDTAGATTYYQDVFGPEAKVLRHGDEFTPYASGRPSPAWNGFMEFLTQTICLSVGVPPSVVLGGKIGGADTRRELAAAQRVFTMWQEALAGQFQRIYRYVIDHQIEAGFLQDAPADWDRTEWQFPPRVTVDEGRDRNADREDVKAGLLTRREYFAQYGQGWFEQTTQAALEAKTLQDLATEHNLDRAEIALLDPNELASRGTETKDAVK